MREILFRGFHEKKSKWVYGYLDYYPTKTGFFIHECADIPPTWSEPGGDIYSETFEVVPDSVGQLTGVSDKNGIPIFEGDILKYGEDCLRVVIYEQAAFHCRPHGYTKGDPTHPLFFLTLQPDKNMQVIGNIYENLTLITDAIKEQD